ncbi:alpha/beta-hydrolase [Lactarius psammicola]|nr:alpha/beta-hydrolase [Lactarius psammicola]
MVVHHLRHHPLKGLYLTVELTTTLFFRLPSWVFGNLPRASRPRPSWSLKKSVLIRAIDHLNVVEGRTDSLLFFGDHLTVVEGPDVKYVWVEPTPQLLNTEIRNLADAAKVAAATIPGYWMEKANTNTDIGAPPRPGEKVVYSLHGGAYIRLSASPRDVPANIGRALLEHCADVRRVFALEYRLSKHEPDEPANPFPAALLDALAGYVYLTDVVGFAPENIVVEGDSAGGNLALALVRYLVENVGAVPGLPMPPEALLLLSPWVDPSDIAVPPGSRANANMASDFIGPPEGPVALYARRAFLGPLAKAPDGRFNRYVAPGCADARMPHVSFEGFPRTMIVAGEAEMLVDQINTLVGRMKRDLGEKVHYYEAQDAVHDFILFPFCEPERALALGAISDWLEH